MSLINIEKAIMTLSKRRPVFTSEADFQLELAWTLKEQYPDYKVRLEYSPEYNPSLHIDIVIFTEKGCIPIELKYKTKGCSKRVNGEVFVLKNHGAKDISCYLYLKDLQRIENIKGNIPSFLEGYTIFLTNEVSYRKVPVKKDCFYRDFSLEDGSVKTGTLDWAPETGAGTKKGCEDPIVLNGMYPVSWNQYSKVDDSSTGTFIVLVNNVSS